MLQLEGVSRAYGDRRALDDVTFAVRPGVLTGFIGANGAGKTTAMRIVLGVLSADSGSVTWRGEPLDRGMRESFGYMPEERGLYPKMRVLDQLVFLARLHGLTHAEATASARALLEELGLAERATEPLQKLSLGNQQRAQLAAALVHSPTVLVLDEPFSGLDPVASDTMAAMLRRYATAGRPVLFSSHQLDLVEQLCDDIVIIHGGRVLVSGSAQELRMQRAGARFRLRLGDDAGWLRAERWLTVLDVDGPTALVELPRLSEDQRLLTTALARCPVHEFVRVVPSLSEIFRESVH